MALQDVGDVVDDYSGISRAVLEYCMTTKRLVDAAKHRVSAGTAGRRWPGWSTRTPSSASATSKR